MAQALQRQQQTRLQGLLHALLLLGCWHQVRAQLTWHLVLLLLQMLLYLPQQCLQEPHAPCHGCCCCCYQPLQP
jgi:hypothetical protein